MRVAACHYATAVQSNSDIDDVGLWPDTLLFLVEVQYSHCDPDDANYDVHACTFPLVAPHAVGVIIPVRTGGAMHSSPTLYWCCAPARRAHPICSRSRVWC